MSFRKSLLLCCTIALLGSGCTQVKQLSEKTKEFFDTISARPRKAAIKTTDRFFPDERWEGINQLVERSYGKAPPYTDQYANMARTDPDFLVRAMAVRALNRSRDRQAMEIYIDALNDESELVRLEGAKALVNMPDEKAIPGLVKLVTNPNENRDVRIAAADALKHYNNIEAARALVGTLSGREFGLAWQAHRSLKRITGKDLQYDEAAWLTYIANPDTPFG